MRVRDALFLGYAILAVLGLTGVLFRGVATADGLVLGLPIGLAWVTAWAVATPFALWAHWAAGPRANEDEGRPE
ncbi:MAG: hypothetical protein AAGA20_18610 [Planctomycetota bacterium]